MKETDLALKFIEFFNEGYEIYNEVPAGGNTVDFVAYSDPIKIGVEVKLTFSLKVIEQAFYSKNYFNYVYVAVPKGKNRHFVYLICEKLNVGVLEYDEKRKFVEEKIKPKINRKVSHVKLEDYMKRSVAGSQRDRITAFRNTINGIVMYLNRHDGKKVEEVLESVSYHWHTVSSAKACMRKWCRNGVIKEFKLENGKLYITEAGKEYARNLSKYDFY